MIRPRSSAKEAADAVAALWPQLSSRAYVRLEAKKWGRGALERISRCPAIRGRRELLRSKPRTPLAFAGPRWRFSRLKHRSSFCSLEHHPLSRNPSMAAGRNVQLTHGVARWPLAASKTDGTSAV